MQRQHAEAEKHRDIPCSFSGSLQLSVSGSACGRPLHRIIMCSNHAPDASVSLKWYGDVCSEGQLNVRI